MIFFLHTSISQDNFAHIMTIAYFFIGDSSRSTSGKFFGYQQSKRLLYSLVSKQPAFFVCRLCSIYSYFGQAFVACVPTVPTAQILAAVFIGLNNFFSGLIVRPQFITGFFSVPYWITPGKSDNLHLIAAFAC